MTVPNGHYATPGALRTAAKALAVAKAKVLGRPASALLRDWVMQRFLARVFHDPDSPWVLKGGTGLLVRLPGARHSQDADMLRPELSPAAAIEELRGLLPVELGDHLTFVLDGANAPMIGAGGGVSFKVGAYTGATMLDRFPIDLTTSVRHVAELERRRPVPIVEVPGVSVLPFFTLYPLPDQVADKVCAMFDTYGQGRPSTRYRDLVDLVLITNEFELDAALTVAAMTSEADRRPTRLPTFVASPGPTWGSGYRATARETALHADLHDLDAAIAVVGACLDPLLSGEVRGGTWNPRRRVWE